MPPVSKQHSASVTARPPSEQSCADRISRSSASVDEQRLQRALGVEIERRRHAAHQTVHDLQVLAAAELAAALAEQHDRRRPTRWKRAADDAVGVLEQADDADDRRRIDRLAVGFVVEADVAAGDRHVERAARRADAFDRLARTAT